MISGSIGAALDKTIIGGPLLKKVSCKVVCSSSSFIIARITSLPQRQLNPYPKKAASDMPVMDAAKPRGNPRKKPARIVIVNVGTDTIISMNSSVITTPATQPGRLACTISSHSFTFSTVNTPVTRAIMNVEPNMTARTIIIFRSGRMTRASCTFSELREVLPTPKKETPASGTGDLNKFVQKWRF